MWPFFFFFFLSNHWGSHIPSSWMVYAGWVFVADILLSRTLMSGSFESVSCMCAQTRPRFTLSSEWVLGEWSQNRCYLQRENPLYRKHSPQRRIEPTTLHQTGQWANHTTSWAIPTPQLNLNSSLNRGCLARVLQAQHGTRSPPMVLCVSVSGNY